ncbi:MAG: branched-chain amino acid ABC transporter permease [Caldilineaceae bacterium]
MGKTSYLKQRPFGFIYYRFMAVGCVLLLCLPLLPGWTGDKGLISAYRLFNLTMLGVWLLITLSLNLLVGYSGQVSLGQAALVLCGAYLTAVFRQQWNIPLLLALGLTGSVTGLMGGTFIGLPAVRLRGPYLGIVTFALAVALPQLLKLQPLTPWTQGVSGIHWTPLYLPTALIGRFTGEQIRYAIILFLTVVLTTGFRNLLESRLGRAFVALREDELAAAYMGIDVRLHKAFAFGVSAFYAGIGGGLFFVVQGYVSPDSLGVFDSILLLVAVVIGGLGSLAGSLYGALFLTFHSELISTLTHWLPHAENSGSLLLGVLLVLSGFIFPQGIAGFVRTVYPGK